MYMTSWTLHVQFKLHWKLFLEMFHGCNVLLDSPSLVTDFEQSLPKYSTVQIMSHLSLPEHRILSLCDIDFLSPWYKTCSKVPCFLVLFLFSTKHSRRSILHSYYMLHQWFPDFTYTVLPYIKKHTYTISNFHQRMTNFKSNYLLNVVR
jgi:hypothetical protein